jgi:hypothetical protein
LILKSYDFENTNWNQIIWRAAFKHAKIS